MDENDDFSLSTFGERRINKSPPLMESSDLSVRHRVTVSLRIFSPHPIEMPARPRIPAMPGMSDIRDDQGLLRGYDVIVPPTEKTLAKKNKDTLAICRWNFANPKRRSTSYRVGYRVFFCNDRETALTDAILVPSSDTSFSIECWL